MGLTASTAFLLAAGASAATAVASGISAKNQAEFQSDVARQQAAREREIAAARARDFERAQSALLAQRRASMGATGVDQGTGSPLAVASDFAAETELQRLRILAGGETQATRLEQEAAARSAAGKAAMYEGFGRAGSSLLKGFGESEEAK